MAGSTLAARNATPLRSPMVQGWATSPDTLTGWPWRIPGPGRPGTLTGMISAAPSLSAMSCTTYSGSPFSSARGRLVSKSTTGSASTAHRNAIADVSTGSFMLSLLLRTIRTGTNGWICTNVWTVGQATCYIRWYQSWGGAMSTPLYRRIAAELRHAISCGELPPGGQLPTEQELGDRYQVSRNTVRLALGLLTNEGIITSTPGRGTFVRDRIMLTYHASRAEAADRPDH